MFRAKQRPPYGNVMKTTVSRAQARHMPQLKSPIWLFVILFFYLPPRQFIFFYWFMFSFSLALLLIYCEYVQF
jgi:hypothetical protein